MPRQMLIRSQRMVPALTEERAPRVILATRMKPILREMLAQEPTVALALPEPMARVILRPVVTAGLEAMAVASATPPPALARSPMPPGSLANP